LLLLHAALIIYFWRVSNGNWAFTQAFFILMCQACLVTTWAVLPDGFSVRALASRIYVVVGFFGGACVFLLVVVGRLADLPKVAMIPSSMLLTGAGILLLRHTWWNAAPHGNTIAPSRWVFSLRSLFVWTAVVALTLASGRCFGGFAREWSRESAGYAVASSFCAIYTIVAAAWVAPRGWIAKFLLLPVTALFIIGLIAVEALALSLWSIEGLGALVAIYVNLMLGGVALVTFLILRISGLFLVDSLFGAEHLDRCVGVWLSKKARRSK
jgi:hypothetical protein